MEKKYYALTIFYAKKIIYLFGLDNEFLYKDDTIIDRYKYNMSVMIFYNKESQM